MNSPRPNTDAAHPPKPGRTLPIYTDPRSKGTLSADQALRPRASLRLSELSAGIIAPRLYTVYIMVMVKVIDLEIS